MPIKLPSQWVAMKQFAYLCLLKNLPNFQFQIQLSSIWGIFVVNYWKSDQNKMYGLDIQLDTLKEKGLLKQCPYGTILENGVFFDKKGTILVSHGHHFTDDQSVPRGHCFGATYFLNV